MKAIVAIGLVLGLGTAGVVSVLGGIAGATGSELTVSRGPTRGAPGPIAGAGLVTLAGLAGAFYFARRRRA